MDDPSAGSFSGKIIAIIPYAVTIVSVVLLIAAAGFLGYLVFSRGDEDTAILRFIALLIIFMVALAATAAVFVSLKMGNSGEAFGLPSGSIRALLAMGIMMLFVVFGLPVISNRGEEVQPVRQPVAYERLDATLRMNREQGFYVQILDPGAAPTATAPSREAVIRILGRMPNQSAAQLDLTKQLLTAIITLLTTVIGFYFGSRSSTDAMREAAGPVPAPAADTRRQIEESFSLVKAQLAAAAETIERWKADGSTEVNEVRQAALARIAETRAELEHKRDEITRKMAEAAAALAAAAAAAGDDRVQHETAARDHLAKAATALAFLRAALGGYVEAVRAIS